MSRRTPTLRRRLVAGLLVLAALGMGVSGLAVTTQLRSFLLDRIDSQLADVAGRGGGGGVGGRFDPGGDRVPEALRRGDLYLALANLDGSNLTPVATAVHDGKALPGPRLTDATLVAHAAPYGTSPHPFAAAASSGASGYRVAIHQTGEGLLSITAISLRDADDTVSRLVLVEVLVGLSVLAALAVLSLWAVRLGLRPLERMADAAGEVAGGDGSWRLEPADDHSEVGRLGRALNTMLGRLETAFDSQRASEERLRRFLSDASHELRTPLTSIRGYAELFRRGAAERPDDLAMAMRRIEAEAARMGVLVEDLLVLARLDEHRALDLTAVDLTAVVRDSLADARAAQPERSWTLTAPEHVPITGAEPQLRQVVANLLANVRVHTAPDAPCEVVLVGADAEGMVRLSVTDHGRGVSPELADRIFERFTTAEAGRTRTTTPGAAGSATGGTGLGLSIVAAIVEAHGGRVAIASPLGGGATVTVELPESGP